VKRRSRAIEIAILGTGNVGSALATALQSNGYPIAEIIIRERSRSRGRAAALARTVGARLSTLKEARISANVLWICVSDDAIARVVRTLAAERNWNGKIVLHSSGALSSRELASLKRLGAHVGSAHPMMSFVSGSTPDWREIPFALEGDAKAVAFARTVAGKLGMKCFKIAAGSKVLYHTMGSFCSPLLVALLRTAEQTARTAGIPSALIPKVMRPILRKTMENYLERGAAAAFSGPMQRGDLATVSRHLRELHKVNGAQEVYLALAAQAAKELPVRNRTGLRKLLRKHR